MLTDTERLIREKIDLFVSEINAVVRQAAVEAVQDALGGGTASSQGRGSGRGRSASSGSRRRSGKRVRRSAADLEMLTKKIVSFVAANPGGRLGDVAKGLGEETKDVRRPAFQLVEDGALRTEGERGGTRYFPGKEKVSGAKKTPPSTSQPKKKAVAKRPAAKKKAAKSSK